MIHIIINPVSGQGRAKEFVDSYVEPLLEASGHSAKRYETKRVKDAARIAREISSAVDAGDTKRTVVLVGGDGTAHEFIEGLYEARRDDQGVQRRWELVIVPLGTANALYASTYPPGTPKPTFPQALQCRTDSFPEDALAKLHSLAAFLRTDSSPRQLPISLLSITDPSATTAGPSISIPSHVVISTCLHANLLATAEGLRKDYPGLERFKVAAQQNAGKFYTARVRLSPTATGPAELYDPRSGSFQPCGVTEIDDDFAYFLSSATCPRLEPTFVISPLLERLPSTDTVDVMIIRPGRDPRVQAVLKTAGYGSLDQARKAVDDVTLQKASEAWIPRAWEVLGKAYQEGAHVDLTYTPSGDVEDRGEGERVVEVYRAGGFTWLPKDQADHGAHLVCADGSLIDIPPGGEAKVQLDASHSDGGLHIWT